MEGRGKPIRLRAVILGVALSPVTCYWVVMSESYRRLLDGSCLPLFVQPIFILAVLSGFNLLLKKWLPKASLEPGDLLVVYIMQVLSVVMAGHDTFQNLFGSIGHVFWFASPSNRWRELLHRYIPWWLTVSDWEALEGFYLGGREWLNVRTLVVWVVPLSAWALYFLSLFTVMLCINAVLLRQWTEHERLSYPIVHLPLALCRTATDPSLLRSRSMWVGFGVSAFVALLNGLSALYPLVPSIKLRVTDNIDLGTFFTSRPWNAIGWTPLAFYPFAVGLAYFLPLDLAFSCWFFYLLRKAQRVATAYLGWDQYPDFPYIYEQACGGWMALSLTILWMARKAILRSLKMGLLGEPRKPEEPMSHRAAWTGIFIGLLILSGFHYLAGMSLWCAVAFLALYLLLAVAIARVRAEFGSPHEIVFVHPQRIMRILLGTKLIGPKNATVMSVFFWLNRCYRNHPMPNQLEAFKMSGDVGLSPRGIVLLLLGGAVVALIATYISLLYLAYHHGAASGCRYFKIWVGWESYNRAAHWITTGIPREARRIVAFSGAFGFVLLLRFMRNLLGWWPFHPAGYPLAMAFPMDYFWSSFLLSWLLKLLILRYGGPRAFREGANFALGLVLGDYLLGAGWTIYGLLTGKETYRIFI